MVKVLFVATVDPAGTSGHNIATYEMIAAFMEDTEVKLSLICPRSAKNNDVDLFIADKIENTYYIDSKIYRSLWYNLKLQFQMISVFKKAIKNEKPDIVVTRLGNCLTLPAMASYYKLPYYVLIRGLSGSDLKSRYSFPGLHYIWNIQLLLNCRAARLVIAAFNEIKVEAKKYRKKDQLEPIVFTNAVNPGLYPLTSKEEARGKVDIALDDDSFVVGFIGSIKKRHGLDLLINTYLKVSKVVEDYKIVIVGEGPELKRLRDLVKSKGLDDKVIFTGFIPHDQVYLYMSAADVLYGVLDPNEYENPIKCYEYLASARPLITSERMEFAFIKENEYGLLVDSYDENAIAAAIIELYLLGENKLQQMGKSGREYVFENHTWQQLVNIIKDDYMSVRQT